MHIIMMMASRKKLWRIASVAAITTATAAMCACYSNNCPLDNAVSCQYGFYDSEGTAITYGDTITVSTLMPGTKTVYIYRKLGNKTFTKDYKDVALIEQGYTESTAEQRRDTVLINNVYRAQSISLPMSYYRNIDTLVVAYHSISVKDTIWVEHEAFPFCRTARMWHIQIPHTQKIRSTDAAIDHIEISNQM